MDKETVLNALKELKEKGKKRKFQQSYDLIITLKNLELKKPEHQVDFFQPIHKEIGKKIQICALVGAELKAKADESCESVILSDDFESYAGDKKKLRKLARDYDWFIAQANIMPKVAAIFGKFLGPKGKMPNPKAGCVVAPAANLKPLCEKLKKTIRISVKAMPMLQCLVGNESLPDEVIADNVVTIYEGLVSHLIDGKNNIKHVLLKTTMGKPIKLM